MDENNNLRALIAVIVAQNGGEVKFHPQEVEDVKGYVLYQTTDHEGYITLRLATRQDVFLQE